MIQIGNILLNTLSTIIGETIVICSIKKGGKQCSHFPNDDVRKEGEYNMWEWTVGREGGRGWGDETPDRKWVDFYSRAKRADRNERISCQGLSSLRETKSLPGNEWVFSHERSEWLEINEFPGRDWVSLTPYPRTTPVIRVLFYEPLYDRGVGK